MRRVAISLELARDPIGLRAWFAARPYVSPMHVHVKGILTPAERTAFMEAYQEAHDLEYLEATKITDPVVPLRRKDRSLSGVFLSDQVVDDFLDTVPDHVSLMISRRAASLADPAAIAHPNGSASGASNMRQDLDHIGATWGASVSEEARRRIARQEARRRRAEGRNWLIGISILAAAAYLLGIVL